MTKNEFVERYETAEFEDLYTFACSNDLYDLVEDVCDRDGANDYILNEIRNMTEYGDYSPMEIYNYLDNITLPGNWNGNMFIICDGEVREPDEDDRSYMYSEMLSRLEDNNFLHDEEGEEEEEIDEVVDAPAQEEPVYEMDFDIEDSIFDYDILQTEEVEETEDEEDESLKLDEEEENVEPDPFEGEDFDMIF